MKKEVIIIIAFLISGLLFANLVKAQDIEQLQNMENPADIIKNKTGGIISEEGINTSEEAWKPFKSKAEERIEAINTWIGPITLILFGVELSLSWTFAYSFVLWICIIILLYSPIKNFLRLNAVFSLAIGLIVSTLAMHGMGREITTWLNEIVDTWYYALVLVIISPLLLLLYNYYLSELAKIFKKEIKAGIEKIRELKAKAVEKKHNLELKTMGLEGYENDTSTWD